MDLKFFFVSLTLLFSMIQFRSATGLASGIELHAHLFMKEGMTWAFNGDFFGPLKARSWHDRFSSQANPESINKSGLDIIVTALYAHPLFNLSLRDSIRRQINLARRFVQENPDWIIAKNPKQAKSALARGKHILILALEGAAGILENEQDLHEFIDEGGIRIVTLLHLTDDQFGGVAFLKGIRSLASPVALLESLFHPIFDSDGYRLNKQGLTVQGRQIVDQLLKRKVWIDLSHSSDSSQNELLPVLAQAKQPLLYTHSVLRKYHHAERGISLHQLNEVKHTGGWVGLMPSEEMLEGTPARGQCRGSIHALATQFEEVAQIIGEDSIGIGSDINGGIPHLNRPNCYTATDLDKDGFWNIGQSQELWRGLEMIGVYHPKKAARIQSASFLEAWTNLEQGTLSEVQQ